MTDNNTPNHWPAFLVAAPETLFEEIEETLFSELDPGDLLGVSRETWRDPRFEPPRREIETGILAVYLAPGVHVELCAHQMANALQERFPEAWRENLITVRPAEIPDADWATQWREHFHPLRITENLIVVPAWWGFEDATIYLETHNAGPLAPNPVSLFIQPGQAFGSGTHATTQLALRMLERNLHIGRAVLDFGAGSGILCFAAAALGASETLGVEIDRDCLSNFEENLALNAGSIRNAREALSNASLPEAVIAYRIGSVEAISPEERFDAIVCNVLFSRVQHCLPALAAHLKPRGVFLYSGFLVTEFEEASAAFENLGLVIFNRTSQDEWGALEMRKA